MPEKLHESAARRANAATRSSSRLLAPLKVTLAREIVKSLDRQGLSVREAHASTGFAAADFSRIRGLELDRFTIDRLLSIIERLGDRFELTVKVDRGKETGPAHPLIARHRRAIAALCRQFAVRRLSLFGSILRSDFDPTRSDIDIAVEFSISRKHSPVNQYFGFKAALESLLERPVDLVELTALANTRLKRIIERTQASVYGKAA